MEALAPVLQFPIAPFLRPRAVRNELYVYCRETVIQIIPQFSEYRWWVQTALLLKSSWSDFLLRYNWSPFFALGWGPSLVSILVFNNMTKRNLNRTRFISFYRFQSIMERSQDQHLSQRPGSENRRATLLACSIWLAQVAFLWSPVPRNGTAPVLWVLLYQLEINISEAPTGRSDGGNPLAEASSSR